jgi:nitroreductase
VYPLPGVIKPVSEILNLPKDVIPLCVVYIGYPEEVKLPRTQYNEHRVYWDQYEPRKKQEKIKNARLLP